MARVVGWVLALIYLDNTPGRVQYRHRQLTYEVKPQALSSSAATERQAGGRAHGAPTFFFFLGASSSDGFAPASSASRFFFCRVVWAGRWGAGGRVC